MLAGTARTAPVPWHPGTGRLRVITWGPYELQEPEAGFATSQVFSVVSDGIATFCSAYSKTYTASTSDTPVLCPTAR